MKRCFFVFVGFLLSYPVFGVTVRNGVTNNFGSINAQLQVTSYTLTGPVTNQTLVAKYTSRCVATLKLASSSYPRPELQIVSSVATSAVGHQPNASSPLIFRDVKTGTFTETRPATSWGMDGGRPFVGLAVGNSSGAFPGVNGKLYLDTPILPYQISLRNSSGATVKYEIRDQSGALLGEVTLQPGESVSAPVYSQAGGNVTVTRKSVTPSWDGFGIAPSSVMPEGGWPTTEVPPNTPVTVDQPSSPDDVSMPPEWDPTIPQGNALSQGVFLLGVDRIISAVRGSKGAGSTGVDLTPLVTEVKAIKDGLSDLPEDVPNWEEVDVGEPSDRPFKPVVADVADVPGLYPVAAPVITPPGSSAVFNCTVSLPFIGGGYNFGFDLSAWAVPIGVFRAFVASVLVVFYFVAVVRVIRSAFSG